MAQRIGGLLLLCALPLQAQKAGKAGGNADFLSSAWDDVVKWNRSMNGQLSLRTSATIQTTLPIQVNNLVIDPYSDYYNKGDLFYINNPIFNYSASYSFTPISGVQWIFGLNVLPDQALVNPKANGGQNLGYNVIGNFDFGDDFKLSIRYDQGWNWAYSALINNYNFPTSPVGSLDELRSIQKSSSLQDSTSFSISFLKQKALQVEPQFSTAWSIIRKDIPWDRLAGLAPVDQYTTVVKNNVIDNVTGNVSLGLTLRPIDELSFGSSLTLNPTFVKNAGTTALTVDSTQLNNFIEWRPSTYTTVHLDYNVTMQTLLFVNPYTTWIPTPIYLNLPNTTQNQTIMSERRAVNHTINLQLNLR